MLGPGVYEIHSFYGNSYIGKTKRSFKSWLKEHMANTFHNCIAKYAIVEHSHNIKHLIFFYKTKILASAPFHFNHVINEALEIESHPNNFNWEYGTN